MRAPSAIQRLATGQLHDMQGVTVALGAQNRARVGLHEILACCHLGDDETGADRATNRRNGASVTPDIGARITLLGSTTSPNSDP